MHSHSRRNFLRLAASGAVSMVAGCAGSSNQQAGIKSEPQARQTVLPRWRGFNIDGMYNYNRESGWQEQDFRWIRDLGFDFVRLPLDYRIWTEKMDGQQEFRESMLKKLDEAVNLGIKYDLHVDLNLHKAPGHAVNADYADGYNLWKDAQPLRHFCEQWQMLAERYKSVPPDKLSFNLLNEPKAVHDKFMSKDDHTRVITAATEAIRQVRPDRIIISDGLHWGNSPNLDLVDLSIAQSCRGYLPGSVTHYKASWTSEGEKYPKPTWPTSSWNRQRLLEHYDHWAKLASMGVGVHCGEMGCYNKTSHEVALAWMRDLLQVLKHYNIGYALWSFRGSFGILDSGRNDVEYEDFRGHKLDRKMLNLLQQY